VSGKHVYKSQQTAVLKKMIELGYVTRELARDKVAKPGMINLIPRASTGRVDMSRRDIRVR